MITVYGGQWMSKEAIIARWIDDIEEWHDRLEMAMLGFWKIGVVEQSEASLYTPHNMIHSMPCYNTKQRYFNELFKKRMAPVNSVPPY